MLLFGATLSEGLLLQDCDQASAPEWLSALLKPNPMNSDNDDDKCIHLLPIHDTNMADSCMT